MLHHSIYIQCSHVLLYNRLPHTLYIVYCIFLTTCIWNMLLVQIKNKIFLLLSAMRGGERKRAKPKYDPIQWASFLFFFFIFALVYIHFNVSHMNTVVNWTWIAILSDRGQPLSKQTW